MTRPSSLNFANQDLRNRCFKRQNLSGANFSGADLRGCDFSDALLQGANFERVQTGRTRKQQIPLVGAAAGVAIVSIDAVTHMLFGVLGRTAAEPGWSFVLALAISLAIAAVGAAISARTHHRLIERFGIIASGTASGALLSFYYGGRATDSNAQAAIAAAVLGGGVTMLLLWRSLAVERYRRLAAVMVLTTGTIAAYGLAFFCGTWAIAALSTQNLAQGLLWTTASAALLKLTIIALTQTARTIRRTGGTSFRGANLTDAKFEGATLRHVDFSGAIGLTSLPNCTDRFYS